MYLNAVLCYFLMHRENVMQPLQSAARYVLVVKLAHSEKIERTAYSFLKTRYGYSPLYQNNLMHQYLASGNFYHAVDFREIARLQPVESHHYQAFFVDAFQRSLMVLQML